MADVSGTFGRRTGGVFAIQAAALNFESAWSDAQLDVLVGVTSDILLLPLLVPPPEYCEYLIGVTLRPSSSSTRQNAPPMAVASSCRCIGN